MICLYVAATLIYAPVISDHPFGYDEADYMWAGKQGLWANYSDRHTISFIEFVRKGLDLSRNPGKRQSYSEYIRSSGDIEFYRHYHGPMYAYWLALVQDTGIREENLVRGSGLLIHFATATLILFGVWALFPSLPPVAALLACALFVFNRSALIASSGITQHLLFTFLRRFADCVFPVSAEPQDRMVLRRPCTDRLRGLHRRDQRAAVGGARFVDDRGTPARARKMAHD